MADCCSYICSNGLRGPYVLGDQISLADFYLYVICTWLTGDGVTLADFPKIKSFMTTMEQRDSVRAIYAAGML